ncbi:Tim44 domain-containing protein [Pseudomonas typographi]|uniref:TIM44-like domain-containing protein n=1 Tax=Pseudomonas typographi TaxID=2715964 RepID=A0ABR7Z2F5_9PSED|nr:TIM44-like domain-containing protein [Pseudomonas typographi]MBD1550274.1 TIM44-like domain-containing protein [Pseudomonas typographi]MBD1585960.1 TIM44-like domain-containing protein [Pseudomonas typographi]MBD1599675.1 TIM44-like domain-containing protein [Pseudomonas typographi]
MKRFLSIAMALCIGLTMSLDATAKRFGGGKSMGAAPTHQTRQAAPATPAAAPGAAQAGRPAASGASRWLGPLAGIAAGGLLASMFMGDGFEGFQFFDFLILALIAFVIFRFIAARRRQHQPPQAATAAGPVPFQREAANTSASGTFGGAAASTASPTAHAPAWFNEQSFLGAAREHFNALQQHWDANEMDRIAEFVTPAMLQSLKQERAALGDGYQATYIDNLQVQVDGVEDRADKTIATLTFTGVSKESRFDQGEFFSESWNMERAPGENQPWLIAGIRQNS